MKTLVTGSYGLVGSEAMKFFKKKGEVIGIDNNMRSFFFNTPEIEGNDFDINITSNNELRKVFLDHKFDLIIHAAAQPSHDWAADHPITDFKINALGTLNLLELTRQYMPDAVFIYVSTNKVYGDMGHMIPWLKEQRTKYIYTLDPSFKGINEHCNIENTMHSLFGCSKLAADIYTQEYGRYFGLKTGIFRSGCITGSAQKGAEQHGFLSYLMKCAKEEKPYTIYGYDGKQVRDNIHAYDLVNAFWHYYQNPKKGEVYNIGGGSGRSISVLDAIEIAEQITGNKMDITYSDKARKGDHKWYITDCSKFRKQFPKWDYEYSLDDIFEDLAK